MSTILPWEDEEEQNYMCMEKIINDIVCKALRNVFKQEWDSRYQSKMGAWDDTSASGKQLFHFEKSRSRPNKNVYQAAFQHGNTTQWDCSVLFDAILYSKTIGQASLNPTIKSEVNSLREIRNDIKHHTDGKLTNSEFQNLTTRVENALKSLGLPVNELNRIKVERNRYKSFQVLPPKPLHEVVYRDEKVRQIQQDLQELHSDHDGKLTYFYISGNPGSGKSQLARQVCESNFNSVSSLIEPKFLMTLNGTDLKSLLHSYENFCRRLNCNESAIENITNSSKPNEVKIKDLRSLVSSRIKNWKRWWIVVDNVENLTDISPLLPQTGDDIWDNGQVIITTQNRTSIPLDYSFTKHVSLSVGMNQQECRQLLSLLSNTDISDPLLDEVADKLDRQPLTMAAAALYMRQVREPDISPLFSWKNYLEKISKRKNNFAEERFRRVNPTYSHTMSRAISLAVERCAKNIIWNHVFHLFSLISLEPMPLSLIVYYVHQQGEKLDADDIKIEIKDCSLFILFENTDTYIRLHRVIHDAIKIFCHDGRSELENVSASEIPMNEPVFTNQTMIENVLKTLYEFQNRSDKIRIIPHLKAFTAEIKNLFQGDGALHSISQKFSKSEIAEIYLFFAETSRYHCSFNIAKEYCQEALEIQKKELSPNHVDVAASYNSLGSVYKDTGDLEKAKEYHQLALEIRKEKLGPNHVDVAISYDYLGLVYNNTGDFDKAKEYHQLALEIRKEKLGPNHADVAASYVYLGLVYNDTGEFEKAKEYHQLALEIGKEQLGPNHANVATSYNNLGLVYNGTGDLEKAKEYYQLALEICKEQLGPKHVNVATSYNDLGLVYHGTGDLEKAKEYYQLALEIDKERLGPKHVNVAGYYNYLGLVYNDKGEFEKAKEYHQLALEIGEEKLGPNHVDVARSYCNLGLVYHYTGDLEKAKEYYQLALEIRKEKLGPNHVDVAISYDYLGLVYNNTGDLEKAKEYHQLALEIRKEKLGPNHVDVAISYVYLGLVYNNTGDLEKAKEYYQLALEICKEQLGPKHVHVATSYNDLGLVYHGTGDLEKAKEYYQLALEIGKERLGPKHVNVAGYYNNLGLVYNDKGEFEKAKEYHQLALEIRKEKLGPNHVDVARSYYNLGLVYHYTGDLEKAKEYYQLALEIDKEQLGPKHVNVATSYNNLGLVYHGTGDLEKAKEYYQLALEIRKEKLGPNHVDVAISYDYLGLVYNNTGDLEKAKEYYQLALQIDKEQLGPKHVNVASSQKKPWFSVS